MTHSTPLRTWLKAIVLDTVLTGGYALSIYLGATTAQSIYIFLFWWLLGLGFIAMVLLVFMISAAKADDEIKKKVDLMWSGKLIDKLAHSRTFAAYHGLTDLTLICLLVATGHPVLASLKVINYFLSLALVSEARERKVKQFTTQEP